MNRSRTVITASVFYAIIAAGLFEMPANAGQSLPARSLDEMYQRLATCRIVQIERFADTPPQASFHRTSTIRANLSPTSLTTREQPALSGI